MTLEIGGAHMACKTGAASGQEVGSQDQTTSTNEAAQGRVRFWAMNGMGSQKIILN